MVTKLMRPQPIMLSLLLLAALLVFTELAVPVCGQKIHVNVGNTETWEREYKNGNWDYLEQVPVERARSAIIVGTYYQMFGKNQSILDVGCGTGTLSDSLFPRQKRMYTGIDISFEAIRIGKERRPRVHLVRASAEEFDISNTTMVPSSMHPSSTPSKYGMIVFNEVIYYTDHMKIFEKYKQMLAPSGHIVISCWGSEKDTRMRDKLDKDAEQVFQKVDEMVVQGTSISNRKVNFKVALFRLRD
jgi:2-polyprenyl-3-methyl-5-hydroxy-6-metoxy-1,4-benzoquinol methylase